jgi:hypothetical protein
MFGFFKKKVKVADKEKMYTFGMQEVCAIGDRYEYKVQAENREEAFKKLVEYFFSAEGRSTHLKEVQSTHHSVTQPHKNSFTTWGMPRWFAKRISGDVRGDDYDYQKDLVAYAIKNQIKLESY